MRRLATFALALSFTAFAGVASADSPKPTPVQTTTASPKSTPATPPKRVKSAKKKPAKKPTPIAAPAPESASDATNDASADAQLSLPSSAPAGAPAPASPPVSVASASPAKVDAPLDDKDAAAAEAAAKPFSIAPLAGISGGGLGLGVGLRAGYTLPSRVYLGVGFMYQNGTSVDLYGFHSSTSAFYPSAEGGYDIRLGRLAIRPYGGLAAIFYSATTSGVRGAELSLHHTSGAIYPGCAVTYDIPNSSFFVGGDARLLFALDGGGGSVGAYGSAGLRF
jgi:hypothetical protein